MLSYLFSHFFAEAETNTETPEMNTETNTIGNEHRANTKRTRKQKWAFTGFLYSFPLLQKYMKTNMAALNFVRFRSVFIPMYAFI